MELDHFSHDHPLILNEEHKNDGEEVSCYGCLEPISGLSYSCTRCQFFLHKLCAELPKEMTHPCHLEHPLTLLPNPPNDYYGRCYCDVCKGNCNRFIYHCSPCKFDVDMKCASMVHNIQRRIEHRCHSHGQLIPLQTPAMFLCHACGTKHEGSSYLCTTCGFWVNQNCASLPNRIETIHHHHPLTLIYSIPYEYSQLRPKCKICVKEVDRIHWVYYCSECKYFVHVNCATSETKDCKTANEIQDVDLNSVASGMAELSKDYKAKTKAKDLHPKLITLPMPDESVDLITQFIKDISLQGKYKEATEISHASHGHPLILADEEIDGICNGCVQDISAPFYRCVECKFFLHQWCAELPNELRHPCHPEHPLLLTTDQSSFLVLLCQCCNLFCDTFVFGCSACNFYLDSKCASLPRIIKHEAHKHPLPLRPTWSGSCSTCNDDLPRFTFVCDPCNLNLCIGCALLPHTVRHRYDEHPFTLMYSPVKDQPDEYYCEICEEEINSNFWFYHCVNCDQSLHSKCIHPAADWDSNITFTGITIDDHPHLVTFVQRPKDNSPCSKCGQPFEDDPFAFECAPCNFWIHFECDQEEPAGS